MVQLQYLNQFEIHAAYFRSWEQKEQFITIRVSSNFLLALHDSERNTDNFLYEKGINIF